MVSQCPAVSVKLPQPLLLRVCAIIHNADQTTYEQLLQRDNVNLYIFWLKDESLEDAENLPAPEVLETEIAENLQSVLEQFNSVRDDLRTPTRATIGEFIIAILPEIVTPATNSMEEHIPDREKL